MATEATRVTTANVSESILVAAAFPNIADAEAAVRELQALGVGAGDISLIYTDPQHITKEGLVQGALFGGVLGGLVGLLFPPVGIIVAAGPILGTLASALAGAGVTAVAGGALSALVSALVAAGMPEEMALRFGGAVHKGDALVIVHTTFGQEEQVRSVLAKHNPRPAAAGEVGAGTPDAQAAVITTTAR